MTKTSPVIIVGAGPAGLGTAAVLKKAGIDSVILDQGDFIGERWLKHYDHLRLNTVRRRSGLPGYSIPQEAGRWPRRDDYAAYLKRYAAFHELRIRFQTRVHSIKGSHRSWIVNSASETYDTTVVVVATGAAEQPYVPPWAGLESFRRPFLHSSSYRNPEAFEGLDVLVVGAGNSASEIALELSQSSARRVRLSVRRAPMIVPRSIVGFSPQGIAGILRQLPTPIADWLGVRLLRPASDTELVRLGFPTPPRDRSRMFTTNARTGRLPVFDSGLLNAVRAGRIEVVAAVESLETDTVRLSDGTWYKPDVVIAATGYKPGLRSLVGEPGLLDGKGWPRFRGSAEAPTSPGVYFVGFGRPLSGQMREIGTEATRLVNVIRRRINDIPI
jgi:putative flavoprotein involved in K+ transport